MPKRCRRSGTELNGSRPDGFIWTKVSSRENDKDPLSLDLWMAQESNEPWSWRMDNFSVVVVAATGSFWKAKSIRGIFNRSSLPRERQILSLVQPTDRWCSSAWRRVGVDRGDVASWEQTEESSIGIREHVDDVQDPHCEHDAGHPVVDQDRKRDCFEGHAKRLGLWLATGNVSSSRLETDTLDERRRFALVSNGRCETKCSDKRRLAWRCDEIALKDDFVSNENLY